MVTKKQEYISSSFKNLGFAFLAPFGSILFQWIVLQNASFDRLIHAIVSAVVGFILIGIGYNFLEEKK